MFRAPEVRGDLTKLIIYGQVRRQQLLEVIIA